jgi:aspartyl-tRNA(Asn)/glutamyl-tRNA(Gln) amidotransferase subunit C
MLGASTEFDLQRLAALARLSLSPTEQTRFSSQLADILAYAAQIQAVPTDGVPPTTHVLAPALVERDDRVVPSLTPDQATANAPASAHGLFQVPKVLG